MSRVFISYRRDDSADVTGRIFDRLRAHFGSNVVFRDVDAIPLGRDFREVIREAVGGCEVLLAVVGPGWLAAANDDGERRLDDPHDFVRLEIEAALGRGIAVVPVLVGRAKMPKPGELPDSLRPLAFRNGLEVRRDPDFHRDVDRLIAGLTGLLEAASPPPSPVRNPGERAELVLPGGVNLAFAWCPPGTFRMGSTKGHDLALTRRTPEYFKNETPVHRVTLTKGFFMGIDPVTQAQWAAVMGTNPSFCKGANRPVEQVSASDADAFCEKLAALTGVPVRLPTEAEWEYACRAGARTEFHFGDVPDADRINYDGNHTWNGSAKGAYRRGTTEAGTFPANPWGLRDMHGNVWEWCHDGYDLGFYATSPAEDPVCEAGRERSRVIRGGSWNDYPELCRAACRWGMPPGDSNYNNGFRVCFTPS